MKKFYTSAMAIIILSIILVSCRKNDTIDNTTSGENNYDVFWQRNAVIKQTFTINVGSGGVITGTKGTKITFPANFAVNLDGTAFSGTATVALKEALVKKEWFIESLSATTNSNLLQSGGMLDIDIRRADNAAELKPAPAMLLPNAALVGVIKVEVPRLNPNLIDLALFLPDTGINGTPTVPNTKPPTAWASAAYYPFGNGSNSYAFQLPKFRWVNCDGLYNVAGTKTTIKVTPNLTANPGATNIQAMLVYKNISTVITLPPSPGFFQSYANSIPVGSTADVVLIGKSASGKILFKVIPANVFVANQNIAITADEVPAATVTAYLSTL